MLYSLGLPDLMGQNILVFGTLSAKLDGELGWKP